MTVNFADELRQRSTEIWKKILNHRFIIELANNTLPVDKFLFYLKQDHYFLGDFSKFLRSAKQKAINNKMNQWLDGLYMSTVDFEMEMQRQMLKAIDPPSSKTTSSLSAASLYPHSNNAAHHLVTTAAKHTIIPTKTTLDYTSYLNHVSSSGTFSEIISVMAPCPWTYLEIAQHLSKTSIQNELYGNWVKFYSSNESRKQVGEIKQILNMLSQNENEKSKDMMKKHFTTACKYEYLFWEMAYNFG
jgi:thiaminase (transcriptional activator TenA)